MPPTENETLESRVENLERIIFGDNKIGLLGLKAAIEDLRRSVDLLIEDRARQKNILIGVVIGLSVTSTASILTLVKVIGTVIH